MIGGEDKPPLTYGEAEAIGAALHDYFGKLGLRLVDLSRGQLLDPVMIMERSELAWTDAVQQVLRLAAERQAEKETG